MLSNELKTLMPNSDANTLGRPTPVAAPGVDAVHDWACASYGRADDGVLIEAERVVVGGAAVVTPSPSPAPY